MQLTKLLTGYGLDTSLPTKILRHIDPLFDIPLLYKNGFIEAYQSHHPDNIFKNCDQVVSFLGQPGTRASFIGVWKIKAINENRIYKAPTDFPYPEMFSKPSYQFEMEEILGFEELRDRVIIDWGLSTRSWHQWLTREKDKTVVEILPKGYAGDFPGYLEVMLTFSDLSKIIQHPDAHRTWHAMLKASAGIYLITTDTGTQYVGSAYGEQGFLGRWKTYVETKHGGNKQLKELVANQPDCVNGFQFSILRTLPIGTPAEEVIAAEGTVKKQLGTRAFGLNSN